MEYMYTGIIGSYVLFTGIIVLLHNFVSKGNNFVSGKVHEYA